MYLKVPNRVPRDPRNGTEATLFCIAVTAVGRLGHLGPPRATLLQVAGMSSQLPAEFFCSDQVPNHADTKQSKSGGFEKG